MSENIRIVVINDIPKLYATTITKLIFFTFFFLLDATFEQM